MNQVDYKKKYEKLKRLVNDLYPYMSDYCKEKFNEYFPKPTEIWDERIRKNIITFLDELFSLGKNANFDKWSKSDCAEWIAWLKKQGEQKPVIEPKFKTGDWVVFETEEWRDVLMVETVDGNGYGMINKACEHISIGFEEEIYMRLWRISYARAGDVLASEHFISIFKELKGNVSFSDYVTYCTDSCMLFRGLTSFNCDMFEFKPATVEQRRMLEDKFEKEGLVWDGYRKELMRKCL